MFSCGKITSCHKLIQVLGTCHGSPRDTFLYYVYIYIYVCVCNNYIIYILYIYIIYIYIFLGPVTSQRANCERFFSDPVIICRKSQTQMILRPGSTFQILEVLALIQEKDTQKNTAKERHTQIRYFEDLSSMSKLSCSLNVEAFDKMPKPKVVACVLRCIELCWLEDPGGLYSFLVSNPMQFKKNVTKQNACRRHCSVRQYSTEVWRFGRSRIRPNVACMVYMLYRVLKSNAKKEDERSMDGV